MKREPRSFLWDLAQACNAVQQFLSGVAFSRAARIPEYRQVIAFRNVLVHGHASLRDDEVWRAIGQSLPQLPAAAEAMLAEADDAAGQ